MPAGTSIFEVGEGAGTGPRAAGKAGNTDSSMPQSFRDYTAYGLLFRSALVLPFRPLPGPPAGEADVTIRFGPTPAAPPHSRDTHTMKPVERGILWKAAPGAFLLHVPGLARYYVTMGRDIVIEQYGDSAHAVSMFFTGTVLAALLQQRGLVTFHASAVATGTGAVLFAGKSGQGKSSLLAALIKRGYTMLSDDTTAVEVGADGQSRVLAAFPSLRLWADVLDALGEERTPKKLVREGTEKYLRPVERFSPTPQPLRACYCLIPCPPKPNSHIETKRVPLRQVFKQLHEYGYRRRLWYRSGKQLTQFQTLVAMAKNVPVFRVTRPTHPFLLDALADRIDAHLRGEPPCAGEDAAAGQATSSAVADG